MTMKGSRSKRKARAVAGVLSLVALTAIGLRWFLLPRSETAPGSLSAPALSRPSQPPAPQAGMTAPRAGAHAPPAPAWPTEPPYELLARIDPVLAPAVWGLFSASTWTQKTATLELSGHFVASDTLTGLSPEAPDTLWVLSEAIRARKGMPATLELLYRDLQLLANLEDYEKDDFVDLIPDPLAIYVPLAVSHAPHVRESKRMFSHLRRLLAPTGASLTEWIRRNDQELRFAPKFLLRLNAYEVLVPYLREHPSEARAVVEMIFPEKRADAVDLSADQIQNIFDSLASDPHGKEALVEFTEGCLTQLAMASGPVRGKITVFLRLNWKRLPAAAREAAEFVIGSPRPEPSGDSSPNRAPPPYARWPKTEWRFTQHFAEERDFQEWERYFKAKGYKPEPGPGSNSSPGTAPEEHGIGASEEDSVVLGRQIPGGPHIVLAGYSYASLETGMMFGPALRRFQKTLARDIQDPSVQGVFIRAHAQFPRTPAFSGAKPGPKLWYDGSCRGGWDLAQLAVLCPECALVGNVGSGRSYVNNPMSWALLEGLGRHESWEQLAKRIRAAVPEYYTRLIGPWTTSFSQELRTLGKPKPRSTLKKK